MKIKCLFLGLAMLLSMAGAFAQVEINGIYYLLWQNEPKATVTYKLSSPGNYYGDIIIPDAVMYGGTNYSVVAIGNEAFRWCGNLTSVIIPNSVTYIGELAFASCTSLVSITIPNSVTSIGDGTFSDCTSLPSITIPNSVTAIGEGAFSGCTGLTSINVDNGNPNYSSDDGVLFNKDKTVLICCPAGKSGEYAIPNSAESIVDYAFEDCIGLTSVAIPNGVTSIGMYAFLGCKNLVSITLPSGITKIENGTFSSCGALTSITIPNNVTSIGVFTTVSSEHGAFQDCESLVSIIIPTSVTGIHKSAFYGCTGLTSITIPNSVTYIGKNAFVGCGLTSITIPNSVTAIGEGAFSSCTGLTSVTLPSDIGVIESSTFSGCTGLTSIIIPNGVHGIGNGAFYNCTGLTSITIPNNVGSIEGWAFFSCTGLTSITSLKPVPIAINPDDVFYDVNISSCTLKVPTSAVSVYQSAPVWQDFNIVGGGILVKPVSNGDGYTTGNALYQINEEATVTAVAYKGYSKFVNWTKNGAVISTDDSYSFTVTEDVELVANFEEQYYTVLVSVNNEEYGSVAGGGIYPYNTLEFVFATAFKGYKFVNWTKDGAVIATDESYSFTVTEDVELVANFEEDGTGIETAEASAIRIYPNPTTGELRMENGEWRIENVDIFDVLGRAVFTTPNPSKGGELALDISHLPTGIYFLRIQTEQGMVTRKVIKK